jgi:poly(3-hydroxyalkanoate) synthetase
MSHPEIEKLAAEYEAATNVFLEAFKKVNLADLDKPKKDGWNARQIIHHLADSESQSCARLKRLVAEPGTTIQGYDENKWAQSTTLGYTVLPIENSLALFKAARNASLETIKRLSVEQLSNAGTHTESGAYDLKKWFSSYINHPKDHAEQLLQS